MGVNIMNRDRREFLQRFAAVCGTGMARALGAGTVFAAVEPAIAKAAGAAALYPPIEQTGIRAQVFEVIVKQAMAGAPWREICVGPMKVNKISVQQIEEEIARRRNSHILGAFCYCNACAAKRADRRQRANQAVAEIPHSEKAPCACANCREETTRIVESTYRGVFEQET